MYVEDERTAVREAKYLSVLFVEEEFVVAAEGLGGAEGEEGTLGDGEGGVTEFISPEDKASVLGATFEELSDKQKAQLGINYGLQVKNLKNGKLKSAGIPHRLHHPEGQQPFYPYGGGPERCSPPCFCSPRTRP